MEGTSPYRDIVCRGSSTYVITIEAEKEKTPTLLMPRINFRSYVDRLGEMLDYPCNDYLSKNLQGWVSNTVLMVINEKFKINAETEKILFKRVHKLVAKKLLSSFDAAPCKNQVFLLHDPVLERHWTWERKILEDYCICWNIVYPKILPLSPFDREVMEPVSDHVFGKAMCEWIEDLAKGMGVSFENKVSSTYEGNLSLAVKQQQYSFEEAQLRLAYYNAYAKDARFRRNGREIEKEIKTNYEAFEQMEKDDDERLAQVLAEMEELTEAHEKEMEKKFESLEMRHRHQIEELNTRLSEQQEKNEKIFTKIQEQISQEAQKVSERQEAHYSHLQKKVAMIEQTHLMTEEALEAQLAQGYKQIEYIKNENYDLLKTLDESREQFHASQLSFYDRMKKMRKEHLKRHAILTSRIESIKGELDETKNKLNHANAVTAHHAQVINHLNAQFVYQQSQVAHLHKKAKKKFLGFL